MNRQQLQKFVQYLIAEHYTEVIPSAQKLADEILRQKTEINTISGAPDPTAGASKDDENSWHLDEMQVCEVVRSYLGQGSYYNSSKQLNCLFGKVREMLRAQDSNGARMLTLITEQFLHDPRLVLWKSHGTPMTEKCRGLWDQLGSLWVCIVLNPRSSQVERNNWKELLESWSKIDVCPQEDPDFRPPGRDSHRLRSQREREYERNRFFRENNQRNALYHQYQQQQQQVQNNDFNQRFYDNPPNPPNIHDNRGYLNNANNNNYDESSSSSSESESDSDDEGNNDAEGSMDVEEGGIIPNRALMDVPEENLYEAPKDDENDILIERINNFIGENVKMGERGNDEAGIFKFASNLPALRDNDDSSRESMDEDQIRDEHEILENINTLNNSEGKCNKRLEDFDDEFLPDQKEILKMNNINYIDENESEGLEQCKENNPAANPEILHLIVEESNDPCQENAPQVRDDNLEDQKKKKSRALDVENKPAKKMKLNNGSSVAKTAIKIPRTIFHKALDAVNMTWDNSHLKLILASDGYSLASENAVQIAGSSKMITANNTSSKSNFNSLGQPLWYEPMTHCAARIDSLRSHGHIDAALRLSVSVVRTMKQVQQDAQLLWHKCRKQLPGPSQTASKAPASDCNNFKCKDCHSNNLFEFTIQKSSTHHVLSSTMNKFMPLNRDNSNSKECHKCSENIALNEESTDKTNNQAALSEACQSGNFAQFQKHPGTSSVVSNQEMPPPPPRKFVGHCMCSFPPQQHIHNQQQQNHNYFLKSIPGSNGHCQQMCNYPNQLNTLQQQSRGHQQLPAPILPQHNRLQAGSSSSSAQNMPQQYSQPMPSHQASNKIYDCKISHNPCIGPMNACELHQKRPCIKAMCCSNAFLMDKHNNYYQKPSGHQAPMNKYPYQVPSKPIFCNGCMRSNCLLKTHSSSIAPSALQPAKTSVPPSASSLPVKGVTLCKNCKTPAKSTTTTVVAPEISKFNIVNYGASTSKSSTGAVQPINQIQAETRLNRKNPGCISFCLDCSISCEVSWGLDSVGCLFDALSEASISNNDTSQSADDGNSHVIAQKYKHIQVPGSRDSSETYLTLAFEAAILALGKQRIMPHGLYSQQLICKQQDQMIARLRNVDLDQLLVEKIKNLSSQMMDGGPTSGFGESIHPESVPMHTLARFLFASLLNQHCDLAFKIGLRAMRFPIFENTSSTTVDGPSSPTSPYARWWTLGHLESQQCSLSSTMLSASKGDKIRLSAVLENARRNIHSSTHLFKLAQDAFRFATPENGPRSHTLLEVAFELGLQVMRMTRTCLNWRRREMVRWLVTCATQLGLEATLSIMQNWYELFTPTEATGPVATTIMSHSTIMRLNLNIKQQEELSTCARTLALQCATKDPPNCALNALTLCENDPMAFETAYHIVIDAANHIMTSSQLFTIARYMEHRGFPIRAYNLAILAMKNVHLAYNQDSHPAINDIHWACALSHTLGKAELSKMIPLVVKNVQCATVLSDILRRCSVPNPGISHFSGHHRGISKIKTLIRNSIYFKKNFRQQHKMQ